MKLFYATLIAGIVGTMPIAADSCGSTATDADGDGHTVESGTDCDDSNANVYNGAPEYCDGIDNDCNDVVDDNPANPNTYYADKDADGYGATANFVASCNAPAGYVSQKGDCNDANAAIHPGAEDTGGDQEDSNCNSHSDYVNTVAGNGTNGFGGDSGAATAAQLNKPFAVALDSTGAIYISDTANHRIRKVSTAGTITTLAGTGTAGFAGDGGSATAAQLNYPRGIAVDSSGNVFVADSSNQRIRKIDAAGTISTVAGTGVAGYNGDAISATTAQVNFPYGLALDSLGNLYIADAQNHRVRLVSGGKISTVAGSGTAGFSGDGAAALAAQLNYPRAVALDSAGAFYVVESANQRVRKVTKDGVIRTVAGGGGDGYSGDGGPATSAKLNDPYGLAVDGFGNIFIADTDNQRIRVVDVTGTIDTVMGSGVAGYTGNGVENGAETAKISSAFSVLTDKAGNLLISDAGNGAIRQVIW